MLGPFGGLYAAIAFGFGGDSASYANLVIDSDYHVLIMKLSDGTSHRKTIMESLRILSG